MPPISKEMGEGGGFQPPVADISYAKACGVPHRSEHYEVVEECEHDRLVRGDPVQGPTTKPMFHMVESGTVLGRSTRALTARFGSVQKMQASLGEFARSEERRDHEGLDASLEAHEQKRRRIVGQEESSPGAPNVAV